MGKPTQQTRPPEAGFTLVELITVMAIIGILVGIALPQFRVTIIQAKEAVLKEDLFRFREAIDQYFVDKDRYPPGLDALVAEGYLRRIEADPITGAADWAAVFSEPDPARPSDQPGVFDVHSASEAVSLNGTPYNEW